MAKKPQGRTPSYPSSQPLPRRSPRQTLTARAAFVGGVMLLLVGGCAQETAKAPLPVTPPEDRASASVIRRPLPETPIPAPPETPLGVLVPAPAPAIVLPANAQYVCVTEAAGQRQQTVIEFSPKVAGLCLKHPEMGPCQYERNACRHSGGRVFAAQGREITMATEAEYDKKVMRIRLKSN
ncbi:MAG TPA: hypothetical protein VGG82_17295 [Casimicrobiaceae bacterium]|jgi:hypothetical protein